jgi:glucose-6-phosphate 1-dehydrogenase
VINYAEHAPVSSVELKDNTVIVVLGASGDLAKKKTVSIIYQAVHI